MPDYSPEISGASVVMIGSFNPAIFHPAWLARYDLIAETQAEDAEVRMVNRDVSSFSTDLFDIEVTHDKFVVASARAAFGMVRDLAAGIFTLLSHTPVRMIGINLDEHYRMPTQELWHEVGYAIVPPDRWRAFLTDPGMRSVLVQGRRPDDRKGSVFVRVEPSVKLVPGVYCQHNDHFEFDEDTSDAHEALEVLADTFDESLARARIAVQHVLEFPKSQK